MPKFLLKLFVCGAVSVSLTGCVAFRTNHVVPKAQDKVIRGLETEVQQLNRELETVQQQKARELQRLKNIERQLLKKLQEEIGSQQATVSMNDRGLVIQFLSQVFFSSGKSTMTKEGQSSLEKIVNVMRKVDREVRIEGHTDNEPIKRTKYLYASNWELSAARALTVLDYFMAKGLDPKRFSVAGYGEHRAVVSNSTKEGRRKNRRVEIVVIPKSFVEKEVKAAKKTVQPEPPVQAEQTKNKNNRYIK